MEKMGLMGLIDCGLNQTLLRILPPIPFGGILMMVVYAFIMRMETQANT